VRSTRLYSTWIPEIGDHPRSSAIVCARATRQAGKFDEVVQPPQDLLDRRHAVLEVHPVEVDPIGVEPLQAALDRADHVLAAVARGGRGRLRHAVAELRRHHEVIAVCGKEVAEQRLGLTHLVALGRVDQRAARLGEAIEHPPRLIGLGAHAPARAEVARSERVLGNSEAGQAAERPLLHRDSF
jgi:hypothetical protein